MFLLMAEKSVKTIDHDTGRVRIERYVDPKNKYAWPLYDQDPTPGTLVGVDLAAPALLSYPIKSKILNMFGQSSEYQGEDHRYGELLERMSAFTETPPAGDFRSIARSVIENLSTRDFDDEIGGPTDFNRLVVCLDAAKDCEGLTSVAVTKILHRKRPDLVPINDSRVRSFYGLKSGYPGLFKAIHSDLNDPETFQMLEDLAKPYVGIDGRPMTVLRALDIIIWMGFEKP
ncbi:MAG: hypothetical protein KGR18_11095 [Acidobacteria bacterium]|nr:hypothetical protein [Acidobacteriota bacterium]